MASCESYPFRWPLLSLSAFVDDMPQVPLIAGGYGFSLEKDFRPAGHT